MKVSSVSQVMQQIISHSVSQQRIVVAICGAPGAGKTTFSGELQQLLTCQTTNLSTQIIAMDGFHFDNDTLTKRGLLSVKGAPDTFNVTAFEELLKNIVNQPQDLWAPIFNRDLEEVIDNVLLIKKESQVIIVEGNYLLLKQPRWNHLKQYFDISIFIDVTQKELQQRLVQRWLNQGYDLETAQKKAIGNDLVNGQLVITHSHTADICLSYR